MNLASLETVLMVARHGSFASVARHQNADPSSISRTVAQVEAELGFRLFHRSTRSLSLTETGADYLNRIGPLLHEFDHAKERARNTVRQPKGTLRLTASVAFAHECIVPHLNAFHTAYPGVDLELLATDQPMDLISQGIDLAIRLTPEPKGDLISTRLIRTRYIVCASPGYLKDKPALSVPEDLQQHDCLRFALPDYRTRWRFRTKGKETEIPVSGKLIIANALALRRAAVEGLGPALLADWLIKKELADKTLISLFPAYESTATTFDTGAYALYASRSYLPQSTRAMIDFLRSKLS